MDTLSDSVWATVEDALADAYAIHFDGCHKIYLSMDKAQVKQMVEYGYEVHPPYLPKLQGWFEDSCALRFVEAVHTVKGDPNKGFVDLIPQGYFDDEYDDDEYDEEEEVV